MEIFSGGRKFSSTNRNSRVTTLYILVKHDFRGCLPSLILYIYFFIPTLSFVRFSEISTTPKFNINAMREISIFPCESIPRPKLLSTILKIISWNIVFHALLGIICVYVSSDSAINVYPKTNDSRRFFFIQLILWILKNVIFSQTSIIHENTSTNFRPTRRSFYCTVNEIAANAFALARHCGKFHEYSRDASFQ